MIKEGDFVPHLFDSEKKSFKKFILFQIFFCMFVR